MDQEKKKYIVFVVGIVIIILLFCIYLLTAIISNNKKNNSNSASYQYEEALGDPTKETEENDQVSNEIKELCIKKIKKDAEENGLEVVDAKINTITYVSDEIKKSIVEAGEDNGYKNTDTFAYVTYSVKYADQSTTSYGAAAHENVGWVTYTDCCLCMRDGYIVAFGTSWL